MASFPPPKHLGPYLRLSHRLSLAPIAYPIISVAFVAFRCYFLLKSSSALVQNGKDFATSTCSGAQAAVTAAMSTSRLMAIQSNQNWINTVKSILDGAEEGLNLCLTSVRAISSYFVGVFAGLFGCLLQFLIQCGLAVILAILQLVADGLNAIGNDILEAVSAAQNVINDIVNGVNDVLNAVGLGHPIPTMNVDISPLNVTVPESLSDTLRNTHLPSLDQFIQDMEWLNAQPLQLLEDGVNDAFDELITLTSFDNLPTIDRKESNLCTNINLSDIDTVGSKLIWISRWMAITLVILVILMIIASLFIECHRYHRLKEAVSSIPDSWATPGPSKGDDSTPFVQLTPNNILILQSQLRQGFGDKTITKFSNLFCSEPRRSSSISWFFTYITHPSALMFLLIGLLGIIIIGVQHMLVNHLERESNLNTFQLGNYTTDIAANITNTINSDLLAYVSEFNGWVNTTEAHINSKLDGFAKSAAETVNNTIIRLYDDVEGGLQDVLGIFGDAITELVRCLYGNRLDVIVNGLEWISEHLYLSLPRLDLASLQVNASSISEMVALTNAATSTNSTGRSDAPEHIIQAYQDILKGELILFGVFLAIWGFVVLEAFVILACHHWRGRRDVNSVDNSEGQELKDNERIHGSV